MAPQQPPPMGHGHLIYRGFMITHTHTHSIELLWTSDQPDAQTSTWQHTTLTTDNNASGGFRTHNPSQQAAADRRFRPHGQCNRRLFEYLDIILALASLVKMTHCNWRQ